MEMPPPAAGTQDAGVTAPTQGVTGVKSGVRSATMPIQLMPVAPAWILRCLAYWT
jgi:hypothetical protein